MTSPPLGHTNNASHTYNVSKIKLIWVNRGKYDKHKAPCVDRKPNVSATFASGKVQNLT